MSSATWRVSSGSSKCTFARYASRLAPTLAWFAAYIDLHMRRNFLNALAPRPLAYSDLINEGSQLQEVVRAQPRTAGGTLSERVGLVDIGPGGQQRTQSPPVVEEHHPVFAPVLLARSQREAPSAPRVKGVGDCELYGRSSVRMDCSSQRTRRGRWRTRSATRRPRP